MKKIRTTSSFRILASQIIALGIVLIMQEYVVNKGIVSDLYLAPPSQIIVDFFGLLKGYVLLQNLWVTFLEFLVGFLSAIIFGVGFGIILAKIGRAHV